MGNFVLYRNGKRTDITGSIEKISQYVDATQLALKHRWQRIYKHESVFSNEIPIKIGSAYDNDIIDTRHALFMAIEDATDGLVDWKKYVDKRNARELYEICKLYYTDINNSNRETKAMVLFYNLLAQEESKQ